MKMLMVCVMLMMSTLSYAEDAHVHKAWVAFGAEHVLLLSSLFAHKQGRHLSHRADAINPDEAYRDPFSGSYGYRPDRDQLVRMKIKTMREAKIWNTASIVFLTFGAESFLVGSTHVYYHLAMAGNEVQTVVTVRY